MELGVPSFEKQVFGHLQQTEKREYSAEEFEEIGNELQICVVLFEGSDMVSWITHDSANFRTWLNSDEGASALEKYLKEFSFERILSRGETIVQDYEHPENLSSLVNEDAFLPDFVAAFRTAYPRPTADAAGIPAGETIH